MSLRTRYTAKIPICRGTRLIVTSRPFLIVMEEEDKGRTEGE
jgi:hypothetical protein